MCNAPVCARVTQVRDVTARSRAARTPGGVVGRQSTAVQRQRGLDAQSVESQDAEATV